MRMIDADAIIEWIDENVSEYTPYALVTKAIVISALKSKNVAPTVGGWISVKDRMPKDGQDVLAYLNNGEETRIAPCNYYNGVWFDSVMNCVVVLQDVTHWMPLPEPPKEDNNEGS